MDATELRDENSELKRQQARLPYHTISYPTLP